MNDPALGYTPANWARLLAVATMPTMLMRKISGADAPARATMTPVVNLSAGYSWSLRCWPWLALSVLSHEIKKVLVELGRVLPAAAVATWSGSPLRAGDRLMDPARQRDG